MPDSDPHPDSLAESSDTKQLGLDGFAPFLYPIRKTSSSPCHPARLVKRHTLTVTLPDGTSCPVQYDRYGPRAYRFHYQAPLYEQVWGRENLKGGLAEVEAKAQELARVVFSLAQKSEQKAMRRKTLPPGTNRNNIPPAQFNCKMADLYGGKYAVCLRLASGALLRLGPSYLTPEEAQRELVANQSTYSTPCVVGICNRFLRRWQEPKFLAPLSESNSVSATNDGNSDHLMEKAVQEAIRHIVICPDEADGEDYGEEEQDEEAQEPADMYLPEPEVDEIPV